MSATPLKVAVTGAAGQIGYSLLFRLASGSLLGPDRPIELRLLEIEQALKALEGVVMELDDCAFPLLAGVEIGAMPTRFDGVNSGLLLVGARPRGPGMERSDLLEGPTARSSPRRARRSPRWPPTTSASAYRQPGQHERADRDDQRARTSHRSGSRTDPARPQPAISQLARKTGAKVTDIKKMTIWGNHSATQYPDIFHAEVGGKNAAEVVNDQDWIENDFIPTVAKRGAAIIDARGASSAASAASATTDAARDWLLVPQRVTGSMAVVSDGSYGVPGPDLVVPVTTGRRWTIVQGWRSTSSPVADRQDDGRAGRRRKAVTDLGLIWKQGD